MNKKIIQMLSLTSVLLLAGCGNGGGADKVQGKKVAFKGKTNCIQTEKKEIFCDGVKVRVVHDEKAHAVASKDGFGFMRKSYALDSDYHKLLNSYQEKNQIDRNILMFSKVSEKALPYAIQRTSEIARRGKTSLRFETRNGDCSQGSNGQLNDCKTNRERTEVSDLWLAPLNQHVYYAYSIYIPKDYNEMDAPYQILGQFHDNEANNFDNQYANGKMYINFKYNHHDRMHLYLTDFTKGQWHDFVYDAIWSKTDKGRIIVKMDGKEIVDYRGQNVSDTSNVGPYFKLGNYRSHMERYKHGTHPTQIVYYDEYRHGKSLSDVSYETTEPLD